MATDPQARVLELLRRFNNGEKVCIEALQNDYLWEGKSERTIGRDLAVIKEYFPDSFELIRGAKGEKGCYKAITSGAFDNFLKPEALSLMVQTFNMASRSNMFDSFDIGGDDKRIIENKIKETNRLYEFKNKPFENKKEDLAIFKKLESSIKHQKYIILEYLEKEQPIKVEVKPYKIIFINENFYLGCEVDHELYEFSMYRISKIKSIEDTKKTYQKNLDIENFIIDMQTPFATYRKDYKQYLIDVVLEVSKEKAYFFKAKQHLKSQQIIEEKENGNLIVVFKVTQIMEVESLIKSWLPYARVIAPVNLKNKIDNELRSYLIDNATK